MVNHTAVNREVMGSLHGKYQSSHQSQADILRCKSKFYFWRAKILTAKFFNTHAYYILILVPQHQNITIYEYNINRKRKEAGKAFNEKLDLTTINCAIWYFGGALARYILAPPKYPKHAAMVLRPLFLYD